MNASTETHCCETIGVLLMAYGSPDRLDDMHSYLLDIRGGRPVSPELLEEITARYRQIGGRSPLLDLTGEQARGLEAELNSDHRAEAPCFRTYLGMRHWEPRIETAVAQMARDGIRRAVGLVMAPHNSLLSTGAYFNKLDEAIRAQEVDIEVVGVDSWHDHPGLIEAIAEKAEAARAKFGSAQLFVVFTAHSLPARILDRGDPYEAQLKETSRLLARRLNLPDDRWQFCFQSAGQSAGPWLGPGIEQVIVERAQAGEKNLLVVPVGFVCDHVEVLYDIDIACKSIAAGQGVRLERSESLNSSPLLIKTLANLVRQAVSSPSIQDQGSGAAKIG